MKTKIIVFVIIGLFLVTSISSMSIGKTISQPTIKSEAVLKSKDEKTSPINTSIQFRVNGLILNPIITEEYVKFFAIVVIITAIWEFDDETYTYDYIIQPNLKTTITSGIHLFKSLTLPNNYTGTIGNLFINAIFYATSTEDEYPVVTANGTSDQISMILEKGGNDYGDGYNISEDVNIFIDGNKAMLNTEIWEVGGQIFLGIDDYSGQWIEGETCPEGDYEVTVSIKNTVVFDGTVTVG